MSEPKNILRLGLPKGSLQEPTLELFKRAGFNIVISSRSYRPSVDVFLKSVDHFWKGEVIAVLLTGMGRDGAEGLRILRESGHRTIAQDKQTSAVFGMPKAAADLKAAGEILALDKIGPRLANMFPVG